MRRRMVVGLVAACSLSVVPGASAGTDVYHNGSLGPDTRDVSPSYLSGLRFNLVRADATKPWLSVYLAAHVPGSWDRWGSWYSTDQGSTICVPYGGQYLGALVWNPHSVTQNIYAQAGYGTASC